MKNSEKLKLVFDFIADYLSDEVVSGEEVKNEEINSENFVITENEDAYKRAYTLMKKMDEIDKVEAEKKTAVREATNPLIEALKEAKTLHEEKIIEDEKTEEVNELTKNFTERTGITLDDEGKVCEVKVGNLKDYVPISDVMENVGPSLNEVRDEDMSKSIAKGKALKSVLKDAKKIIDK